MAAGTISSESAGLLALQRMDEAAAELQERGKYMEALETLERGLVLRQHLFGAESEDVWSACKRVGELCNMLAMTYLQQEDFGLVLELLKKAEILTERDPAGTAVTFNNLACYYRRRGKLHAALTYLQKAVKIEARLTHVDNPADTYLNLCAVLSQLGRHKAALDNAQTALIQLQEELFNDGSTEEEARLKTDRLAVLVIAYHNIGVEQEFLQRTSQALQSYKKGVELAEKHLGEKHGVTIVLRNSLIAAKRAARATRRAKRGRAGRGGRGGGAGATGGLAKLMPPGRMDDVKWSSITSAYGNVPGISASTGSPSRRGRRGRGRGRRGGSSGGRGRGRGRGRAAGAGRSGTLPSSPELTRPDAALSPEPGMPLATEPLPMHAPPLGDSSLFAEDSVVDDSGSVGGEREERKGEEEKMGEDAADAENGGAAAGAAGAGAAALPADMADMLSPRTREDGTTASEGERMPDFPEGSTCLVQKYLTPDVWQQLREERTESGVTLMHCLTSGLNHAEAQLGILVGDKECYTLFAPLLRPIVEALHGELPMEQERDVNADALLGLNPDPEGEHVKKVTVHFNRNFNGFPLPSACTATEREAIQKLCVEAFEHLPDATGLFVPLASLDKEAKADASADGVRLVRRPEFELGRVYGDWPLARGLYSERGLHVFVNGEDHIRVTACVPSGDIVAMMRRVQTLLSALEGVASFQFDRRMGYITTSPTLLGNGMEMSVELALPKVAKSALKLASRGLELQRKKKKKGQKRLQYLHSRRTVGWSETACAVGVLEGVAHVLEVARTLARPAKPTGEKSSRPRTGGAAAHSGDGDA
eukprot:PLAT10727.1.p1 GENE.PLAT10727.1~~PLAT10727.1.p1  ORF type:complete len:822 (-),score=319.69 PLAT10727.1:129-2594(-)